MNDVFQILEFDRVKNHILKHIKTHTGKTVLSGLKPALQASPIVEAFILIRELTEFIGTGGSLQFDEICDITQSLDESLKDGAVLDIHAILEIRKTLDNYSRNRNILGTECVKVPKTCARFGEDTAGFPLIRRIDSVMDADGNLYDHASEELRRIRKRKGSIRGEIQGKLNARLGADGMDGIIQDKIITIRDGRFVIPIRSQYRNKMRSEMNYIVHSFSKTGETVFVEPEDVVALNNEIIEIDEQEAGEIRRILRDLTSEIGREADTIRILSADLGLLESLYGRAKFAKEFRCGFPEITETKSLVSLVRARHPLLGPDSVPITLEVGHSCQGLVISGPNAGGKTVALKTVGLLVLMAQSSIPIPADSSSVIGIFDSVMPEIGDEQSIAENLSSFSGHILSLSRILEKCGNRTLVLVDEIASSTEPKEGEAIGREIIRSLLERGARFVVTTHFHGIKEIGYSDNRVRNAFVEFDGEKLVPKYSLSMDGTGSSYALKVAKKYGLPESLIQAAEKYLEDRSTDSEKLLKAMENERNEVSVRKSELETRLAEASDLKTRYENTLRELQQEKERLEKNGIKLLKRELDESLSEISTLKMELKRKKDVDLKAADDAIGRAAELITNTELSWAEKIRNHPSTLTPGMRVYVSTYGKEGTVEDVKDDRVQVRIGIVSTTVGKNVIFEADKKQNDARQNYGVPSGMNNVPTQLDLRGMLLEEAVKTLEKTLDRAVMNGTDCLHIIHGKGEGILRKGIWDFLTTQDHIKSYEYAKPEEGGQGKTIVFLK